MTQAYSLQWPKGWPRTPDYNRRDAGAKFGRADFTTTVRRLQNELDLLGAENCVLSTNLKPRMDGSMGQDERSIHDPGVAIYFTLRNKPMSMARDAFTKPRDGRQCHDPS